MKTRFALLVLALIIAIPSVVLSEVKSKAYSLTKAHDFMKANMYDRAVPILRNLIDDSPAVVENHFLLGQCYLNLKNAQGAEESFNRVITLNASQNRRIGTLYKELGYRKVSDGDFSYASYLLLKSTSYNAELKIIISSDMLKRGKHELGSGEYYKANNYFFISNQIDGQYNKEIANLFFNKAIIFINLDDYFIDDNLSIINKKYFNQVDFLLNTASIYNSGLINNEKNNVKLLFHLALKEYSAKNIPACKKYYEIISDTYRNTKYSIIADKQIQEIEQRDKFARKLFYENYIKIQNTGSKAVWNAICGKEWLRKEIVLHKGEPNRIRIKSPSYSSVIAIIYNKNYRWKKCDDLNYNELKYYHGLDNEKQYGDNFEELWMTWTFTANDCLDIEYKPAYEDAVYYLVMPIIYQNDFTIEMVNADWVVK